MLDSHPPPPMHTQSRPIHLSEGEKECVLKELHSWKGSKDLVGIPALPSVRGTPELVSFVTIPRESWCVCGGGGRECALTSHQLGRVSGAAVGTQRFWSTHIYLFL